MPCAKAFSHAGYQSGSTRDVHRPSARSKAMPSGKKAFIVLDQFEQWLHARRNQENTELVKSFAAMRRRACQCPFIMVRDDFWLAVSRFMRELEVNLAEGRNMALNSIYSTKTMRSRC